MLAPRIAWVALFVMLAAALLPTFAHALASSRSNGAWAEICTPQGMRLVSVGTEASPSAPDPISAAAFDELLVGLQRELALTVVMITHDLDSIFRTCNRVGVIVDRKLVADELKNIVDHPHPWIQAYFHGDRARRFGVLHGT